MAVTLQSVAPLYPGKLTKPPGRVQRNIWRVTEEPDAVPMTTVPSLLIPCGYTCLPYRVKMGVLHVPVWQLPRFPLQAVLSGAFGVEQTPVLVLHVPAV